MKNLNDSNKFRKMCIFEMSLLFNQKIEDRKIEAYSKMLQQYSVAQITMAFTNIIKSGCVFFPSCAEIIVEIDPVEDVEDLAQRMVDNIVLSATTNGRYNQKKIVSGITELESRALHGIGGCMQILNSEISDMPIVKSQLRRSCKSVLSENKNESTKIVMNKLSKINDVDFISNHSSFEIIGEYSKQLKKISAMKLELFLNE